MTPADWALFGVIGALAVNHVVMRIGALRAHPIAFWALQLANLAIGTTLLVMGLPGFERFPAVSWLIALFFFMRTVLNNNQRATWLRSQGGPTDVEKAAKREQLLEALRKGEERRSGQGREDA